MPLNERSATALVRFTGLAIFCHNKTLNQAEMAVIRDSKHTFCARIERPTYQGGGNDVLGYEVIASYENLPKQDVQIEIKSSGPSSINGYEAYKPGTFNRLDSPDPNDFRWIPNLCEMHAATQVTHEAPHPLTKLYFNGARFYAQNVDASKVFEKIEKGRNGTPEKRELFGSVGETIGAMLEGDEVSFTISFDGRQETHVLPKIDGIPYRITMTNMNSIDNAVYSDMADYYGYLKSADGTQFDFARVFEDEVEQAAADSVNQIEFCHPIADDDLDTIDDLPQP
jgi:hypothetical protein